MEEKLTFEGQPITVFHEREIATEARKVQEETIKTLKRMIGGTIKPKYCPGKMKHGAVRYYSNEEVLKMNQKVAAQSVKFDLPADSKGRPKLERLLAYIADRINVHGYFSVAIHISKSVDEFYKFMGEHVRKDVRIQYHRGTLYQDLKRLARYGKIYSKGNAGSRQYFLTPSEQKAMSNEITIPLEQQAAKTEVKKTECEVEVVREQPGGSLPDIVQRVVFNVIVNVKMNFTS
jgi:hypothetical protein